MKGTIGEPSPAMAGESKNPSKSKYLSALKNDSWLMTVFVKTDLS